MGDLLGGAGGGGRGGPDELRAIVSKAARARTRVAAIAAGVALAAGGGVGYGISSATTGAAKQQIVATSPQSGFSGSDASGLHAEQAGGDGSTASGAPAGAPAAILQPVQLKKLFTRNAGSIDIRGFLATEQLARGSATEAPAICPVLGGTRFQGEISTPDVVGIVSGFLVQQQAATGPIELVEPSAFGFAEGSPVQVVVVHTSSSVGEVKMEFAGGASDQMAPVQGWSALAAPYSASSPPIGASYGTLTAFGKSGQVLATQKVGSNIEPPLPLSPNSGGSGTVHGTAGASGSEPASSGTGSSGTGSSGAGSSGGGTSPPGSASSPPASAVSPPVSSPGSTSPSPPVYPCKAVPLPAQVAPNNEPGKAGAAPGSGG